MSEPPPQKRRSSPPAPVPRPEGPISQSSSADITAMSGPFGEGSSAGHRLAADGPSGRHAGGLIRAQTPQVGAKFDRYVIAAPDAGCAAGPVFRATDSATNAAVLLHLLPEAVLYAGDSAVRGAMREASAACGLRHPNLVPVLATGRDGREPYVVTEPASEPTAADRLAADGPFPPGEAARIARDAALALAVIHRAALTHRAVRPENIRLGAAGAVRLDRFGFARMMEEVQRFRMGVPLAAPHHTAPEFYRTGRGSTRSDVYALGATFYQLLTGRTPFTADTSLQVLHKHAVEPVPDPRELVPYLPEPYAVVIRKAMAKDPGERYAGGAEMAAALDAVLKAAPVGRPAATRRPRLPRIALRLSVVAVVVASFAAWAVFHRGAVPDRPADPSARTPVPPGVPTVASVNPLEPEPVDPGPPQPPPPVEPDPPARPAKLPEPPTTGVAQPPPPVATNPATPAPALGRVWAVNLGGPEVAGFRADKGNRPDSRSAAAAKPVDVSAVGDAAPGTIYLTERFSVVGYTHTATGLAPGAEHTVRLHFAETWVKGPGLRRFHVEINGERVLTDFDITVEAGGTFRAIFRDFPARADAEGRIVIDFRKGSVENPKCCAVEIFAR